MSKDMTRAGSWQPALPLGFCKQGTRLAAAAWETQCSAACGRPGECARPIGTSLAIKKRVRDRARTTVQSTAVHADEAVDPQDRILVQHSAERRVHRNVSLPDA